MARLRFASGSVSRSDTEALLPRRKSSTAWPPVMAMVNQGLVAAKRSADLDQQYRESAQAFGRDIDRDSSGVRKYEGTSPSASTTGTPPTKNPVSSYAMEICNPTPFEFDSFRMATPATTPNPTMTSDIVHCDIHQIANSQQHSPPLQQWRKQPRFRVKGRSRWRRVGEDYSSPSFQRHLSGARHSPSLETATSLKRRETELRQRQLSPRFLRFLEAKPLPVVRSISRATLRRRPSYRRSFKLFAVNANKPLPPIPTESNTSASDRSDLPKIKECIGSPVFENDSYHEATSNMACHQDRGNCNRQRDYCSTKEEVTMATTTHQQSRHIIHGEHVCDGGDRRPVTDGSDENGEELIALAQKKNDSSSPPSLAFPHIDHDGKDNEDKFNQNSVSARSTSNSTSGFPSASTAAVLPVSIAPIAATTDSSTVAVVTSAKRLESFRFPMRKSPIEKHTPTRLRLHQHSHHQSLPYNTTHSRVLGKALDVHSLSPSDLIQNSRPSSSNTSSRTTSPGLDVVAGLGTTGSSRMLTGHDIKDLNAITATDYDGTAAIPATPLTTATTVGGKHESGSEKRSHRRHGPQILKRSESCGYISYHRPSLSFNSSKKALLSLQDRRINKPDAKVRHRLPDIRTTAQTATTTAVVVISGGMGGIYSDDDFRTADALPSSSGLTNIGPMPSSSRISGNSALGHIGQDENGSEIEVETVLRTARVSCDDLVDYQIQVSDKDQSRIEAMHADEGRIQQTSQGRDVTGVSTNEPREDLNSDIPLPLSNTVIAAEPAPEHESGLGPALETFTIDPNPVIDAGEIKRFVKRSHALLELETTEESYVNDLDILVHVYLRILESRSWFPQIILAKMRRCVSGLLALHRDFHSKLKANKVDDLDREQQAPLKVYRDLAESFRALDRDNSLYSTFCELRMRTVKEINRSAGQATMTLLQRESKELMAQQGRPSSRADLKDFLIKPIQRVCRYPLLLKEILRLTSEDDPEYQYIDQAYRLMKDKAREMDETQRVVERKLLTEQFLKKLPETSFPRKVGITTTLASKEHSGAGGNGSSNNDGNATNGGNYNAGQFNIHSLQHCTASPGCHYCGNNGPRPSPGGMSDSYFDFGPAVQEGLAPAPLTKAFAGTLGSIVLAGALEYVITPDMPIRLKYYGCFLFETVLIVVKAKKSSLYEPRLWLPLRLCELQETTRLDGYTRFGWRIVYDQFRVDFGASCDAEQQVWVSTLQDRIQTAKDAYSKLPREIAAFETIISSLPWKLNNKTHTSHNNQIGSSSLIFGASSLGGLSSSTRHLHVCQQSPSPSLSPWSSCSSAIPSPLMPPPPLSATAPSSNGTTMMMAMSSMVTIEPEKWNACGSGPTWDSHTYRRQSQHENHSTQPHPSELSESHNASSYTPRARVASCGGDRESIRIGGMVGSGSLDREHADQYQQPPSASSSSTHSLYPATSVMPWLLPETRTRSHSFDVTRVFTSSTSSHNSIKPNQRALVQSMFKDVSTENIWTTTSVSQRQLQQGQGHLQLGQLGQPSPQPTSALSLSRYGSASPLSYFHSMTTSTNNNNAGMVPLSPSMGNIGGGLYSLKDTDTAGGWNTGGEDEGGSSSTVSLTSRLLRRRGSGDRAKCAPGGAAAGCQEKGEKDRRRNSATATIAGTLSLNFRKNSDPQQHSNSSSSGHRRHPSIPEAFVAAAAAAAATGTQDDHHMKSQESAQGHSMSVKARAQVIEKKSSSLHDAFLTSVTSSSSLSKMKIKSKVCSLHLRSHKESSSSLVADDEDAVATIGSGMATRDRALSMGGDMEILDTLSSVGEIARSRRGGSERIARKVNFFLSFIACNTAIRQLKRVVFDLVAAFRYDEGERGEYMDCYGSNDSQEWEEQE
ncbi:hypothetical protein BGZ58_009780 [Dissophora ornata]|nr:hypothetical protein BGZ58_009780 [Dissophora ornata]